MQTLSRRTNILFDQKTWGQLSFLAKKHQSSIGHLIRQAVGQVYFSKAGQVGIAKIIGTILRIRPRLNGRINYKNLINYGRRI